MLTSFDPVRFSNEENEFLLAHLGEPSVVALKHIRGVINPKAPAKDSNPMIYPDGVVPGSVKPVLDGVYELAELATHEGLKWVGVERMKEAIKVWLRENRKWASTYEVTRGRAPRFPSLYSWDAKGKGHWAGPGSDSGQVRHYFGPAGERLPFAIDLIYTEEVTWVPPGTHDDQGDKRLSVDSNAHRLECRVPLGDGSICGHTETYKEGSRASFNAARARMSKHLRKATNEAEAHREVHTMEFGN